LNPTPVEVLFIEDSELDVELAVRALRQDGLQAHWRTVASEPALQDALVGAAPEVILSDFSMPGFDGMKALQLVRELVPQVPFIFLSGTIGEERAIEAIRCGATDYVLKDNMRRLGTAVKRALSEAIERGRIRVAEEERARLVQILEATSDYVGMSDPEGRQIYLNAAGHRMTGIAQDQIAGKRILDIYPPWAREIIEREGRPTAAREGIWQGETAILGADGEEIPVSQVLIAHRAAGGEVRFFSSIARDISERKAYETHIEYLANYDALSGLPNRRLLGDRTAQAIAQARRRGRACALVVLNIDRFKLANDSYGHGSGDTLLKILATRLQERMREGDTPARLGADSFAVLATDLHKPEHVLGVLRELSDATAQPFPIGGHEMHVTLSMGASVFPKDGGDFDVLLRNADAAMHRVKAAGGKGFQFYAAEMTRDTTDRLELENALRGALERGELQLHYQPQVDIASGRVIAVEALMRWRHAERGWVSPAQFIPIAEESGLILRLGEWALGEACRQLAAWDRAGSSQIRMAVNVSARQFLDAGFVDSVERALREHQVDPRRIELELTESLLIEDPDQANSTLQRLKVLGVMIAVDDFGTGYSSLSYLSGLPVDCLKIDRAFVTRVSEGGRDATIAQAIISLAHSLGMRVLAEGVETAEQREFLHAHGCEDGQGYFYARPCPPQEAHSLIAAAQLPLKGKP
jgi:diguanylate cyclase (GGDEF)-like protein/PAS domain S-box-containing protein